MAVLDGVAIRIPDNHLSRLAIQAVPKLLESLKVASRYCIKQLPGQLIQSRYTVSRSTLIQGPKDCRMPDLGLGCVPVAYWRASH